MRSLIRLLNLPSSIVSITRTSDGHFLAMDAGIGPFRIISHSYRRFFWRSYRHKRQQEQSRMNLSRYISKLLYALKWRKGSAIDESKHVD